MQYAILIYGAETDAAQWSTAQEREIMGRHTQLRSDLRNRNALGPVMRLKPNDARVVRYKERRMITDGPFTETKEQLMGLYIIEGDSFDEALRATEQLLFPGAVFEIRELVALDPGVIAAHMPPE